MNKGHNRPSNDARFPRSIQISWIQLAKAIYVLDDLIGVNGNQILEVFGKGRVGSACRLSN